jgi:dTDP-4-dehydrorhamnose 3,5-epimerase
MSARFNLIQTSLEGLTLLQRNLLGDHRGYLERLFCQQELKPLLNRKTIAQINHTLTEKKGTVRGIHFQYPPHAEMKFVSCIHGEVFDVAVDLRKDSPTFLQYHAEILTADNHKTLIIPEGFAHGFQTLTQDCEMLYFHTQEYTPEAEGALNVIDPQLNIQWPLEITKISERDQNHPLVGEGFEAVNL